MSVEAFREEVRSWLEENCPASMRTPMPADEYREAVAALRLRILKQNSGWTVALKRATPHRLGPLNMAVRG